MPFSLTKVDFWTHGPALPPQTTPEGPGKPKMAKMHSLMSDDDSLSQKKHFGGGVKNVKPIFSLEMCQL